MSELTGDWNRISNILNPSKLKAKLRQSAARVGNYGASQVKKNIINGNFTPLHPVTIARKHSSKPLVDHGDLVGSITYQVLDDNNSVFIGVKKGKEANIAAAQAQKLVKEAEAKKQAAELDAQAAVAKAQGEADAERIKADAQAYTNKKISENYAIMKAQWDYEIELERAKRWNGKEVPEAAYVVPGTGAVVPLKSN